MEEESVLNLARAGSAKGNIVGHCENIPGAE
jgi:hypothetical protein